MQRQLFGNEHPDVANSLNSLAAIQGSQGKLAEAEASEREAVAIQRKVLGKEHLEVANSLNTLATLLQQQSKLADAEQTQRESLEMRAKTLGEGHPEVAVGMANLAVILRLQNKLTDAENLLRRAVALQRKLLVSTPSEAPAARNNLAMSLRQLALTRLAQEEFVDAEATARECLQLAEQELPDDFQTHHARHLVGASLLGQKEFAKAEPLLVAGFEGMQKQSARTGAASKSALLQAAKRLIQLYELTQQPEKQQAWQGILAELDSSKP
jgi:hypothetical protein